MGMRIEDMPQPGILQVHHSGLNEETTRPHCYASWQGYGEKERKKMGPKLAQAAISFKFHAIYFFVGLQT